MVTILFAWELGGGLGHVTRLAPVAESLVRRGHRVIVALRDVTGAERIFGGTGISYLQAPFKNGISASYIRPPLTFSHILHNVGFASAGELLSLANAWRSLYDAVKPDMVICDHSPTALLATRGLAIQRTLLGDGFCSPPVQCPLPDLRPWLKKDTARLGCDEHRVLATVNRVLAAWNQPPLECLADLYRQVDENLLTTFSELDHFSGRTSARYWGAWPMSMGSHPIWPQGDGKRVFAYLKPFESLPQLLGLLERRRVPSLVYVPGMNPRLRANARSGTIQFAVSPVDLKLAARDCDLAILNAGHGTTATMLLAGKPTLQLPIYLEQQLVAQNVVKLGAGLAANRTQPDQIEAHLERLLGSDRYAACARRFAARYAEVNPEQQLDRMVDRIERLVVN